MKCPEAVEWMHRYLDGDLNEEEVTLLKEHLRSCEDCAGAYDVLKRLSDNLYQLPDVTPKFSIVDSILPRLDEIDRARAEEGSALEVTGSEAPTMKSIPSRVKREKPAPFWRSRSARPVAGGVAAAAVILGFFIYQYQPKTIPNAEIAPAPASSEFGMKSEAQSQDTNASGAASPDTASSFSVENPDGRLKKETTADPADSGSKTDSERKGTTSSSTDNVPEDNKSSNTPSSDKDGLSASTTPGNAPSQSSGKSGKPEKSEKVAEPNVGKPAGNSSGSSADSKDGASQDQKKSGITSNKTNPETSLNPDKSIMGITSFAPIQLSPDGKFTAEVNQDQLKIYANNGSDRTLLTEITLNGDWVKGEWSEDSKIFSYQTSEQDTVQDYTYKVDQSEKDNSTNSSQ